MWLFVCFKILGLIFSWLAHGFKLWHSCKFCHTSVILVADLHARWNGFSCNRVVLARNLVPDEAQSTIEGNLVQRKWPFNDWIFQYSTLWLAWAVKDKGSAIQLHDITLTSNVHQHLPLLFVWWQPWNNAWWLQYGILGYRESCAHTFKLILMQINVKNPRLLDRTLCP